VTSGKENLCKTFENLFNSFLNQSIRTSGQPEVTFIWSKQLQHQVIMI